MFWSNGFGIVPNTIGSHYTSMLLDAHIWDTLWSPKHPTKWGHIFDLYHSLDMITNGINTLIPYYWICVQGGVQVLDPTIYNPPSNSNIIFIMHMIFYRGLGHIINMPMYMPHKGTMYSPILMNM
jgi:hypothetical protein